MLYEWKQKAKPQDSGKYRGLCLTRKILEKGSGYSILANCYCEEIPSLPSDTKFSKVSGEARNMQIHM